MGQGMSEIIPGVYVASAFVARQKKVLNEFGITHIISIMNKPINPLPDRKYLSISAKDHISQDLLQFVAECNDFIHEARLNQGKVMIHCVEGKSRSPTMACIYIMTITGVSWSDAINSIRGVRMLVEPNFAFQRQLKHFHDQLMEKERERLLNKYGDFDRADQDRVFVMKNLELYQQEQIRRTSNKPTTADRSHLTMGDRTGIELIDFNEEGNSKNMVTESDTSDTEAHPITPESERLLDEMFSS